MSDHRCYFSTRSTPSKDGLVVVLKITLIIFVIEGVIMLVLAEVDTPVHGGTLALIDAFALMLFSTPAIYFWVTRPFMKAREKSDQQFRQLAENIDEVFWMRSADFKDVIYVNPKFERFWGKSCQSLYDRPEVWFEAIHPQDRQHVEAAIGMATEKNLDAEYRIVHPGGTIYWIRDRGFPVLDGSGKVIRIAGIAEDVSERKKTERALENEARLGSAFDAIDEGVWDWNMVTGDVYFTSRWPEIFGYTLDEIEPCVETWESRLHPDDKPKVLQAAKDHMEGKTPYYLSEHRMKNRKGEWIWIRGRGKVMAWDDNGKPIRIVSADLDITERKRAVEKQRQLENEMAHLSRLAVMGELTTVLAHELSQPLTVIASGSQLLRDALRAGTGYPATLLNIAELVTNESKRAGDLVHRIRTFVCKEDSSRISTSVNDLIDGIADLIQLDAQRADIAVELDLGKDLPKVFADPVHIQQVILNLVHNGVEAMNGNSAHPCRITINTDMATDDMVTVSVEDTGTGIPAEIRDKIFDPFFTTKTAGLGMGLSICRTIIEAHEGTLWADTNDDTGTVFVFTLPTITGAHPR
jgi:PAS domain S-box-containing protein